MNAKAALILTGSILLLASCGKSEDELTKAPEAPKRAPMELYDNPPMSSSDIDAIVKEKVRGVSGATPEASNGSTSAANTKEK